MKQIIVDALEDMIQDRGQRSTNLSSKHMIEMIADETVLVG